MKGFFRFVAVCFFFVAIFESQHKERERKWWEEAETRYKKSQQTRNTAQGNGPEMPYSGPVKSGVLEGDSLERQYDQNYMDYDQYNNPDDDDEWHDYFND